MVEEGSQVVDRGITQSISPSLYNGSPQGSVVLNRIGNVSSQNSGVSLRVELPLRQQWGIPMK